MVNYRKFIRPSQVTLHRTCRYFTTNWLIAEPCKCHPSKPDLLFLLHYTNNYPCRRTLQICRSPRFPISQSWKLPRPSGSPTLCPRYIYSGQIQSYLSYISYLLQTSHTPSFKPSPWFTRRYSRHARCIPKPTFCSQYAVHRYTTSRSCSRTVCSSFFTPLEVLSSI